MRRLSWAVTALAMTLVVACGEDGAVTAPTTTTTTPEQVTTTAPTTTIPAPTSTTAATSTTATVPETTTPEETTTTLAGEPIEFGPVDGDILMVIGVRHDDVLNLRAGPGTGAAILQRIPPTFTDLVALGNTRRLPRSFWIEVDFEGTRGWVNLSYVGYGGVVDDLTSTVVDELGEIPTAPNMVELGELVAGVFVSEEPESTVVQTTAVSSGDLAEVTFDVIGLGDDALRGLRLHVFAEILDDGFSLKAVEVTSLCGRGVTNDGSCV